MRHLCFSLRCVGVAVGIGAMALPLTHLVAQTADHGQPSAMLSGCQVSGARKGLFAQATTDGKPVERRYLLQVPESYRPQRAYPLVFVFHGKGGTAEQSHSWGLQDAKGAGENAIFVYPQGVMFRDYGVGWDDGNPGYDMPFFDHMLRDIEASYCVDATEVFVAGFSWGGDFATALACARGDKIRAVAVNSATDDYGDQADYRTYRGLPCPSREQPAIRFEHAVERDAAYPPPSFATTSKLYQVFDRCSSESKPVAASGARSLVWRIQVARKSWWSAPSIRASGTSCRRIGRRIRGISFRASCGLRGIPPT